MFRKNLFFYLFFFQIIIFPQKKAKLEFSHERGFYNDPFTLTISYETPGANIKYTLNGSNPFTSASAVVSDSSAEILIDPAKLTGRDKAPGFVVSACAVLNDTLASKIVTHTYLFPNKITELSVDNAVPGSGWLVPGSNSQQISYGLDPRVYNNSLYKPQILAAFTSIPTLSIVTDLKNLFSPDSGIYVNAFYHGDEWERPASLELLNPDSSDGFQINCGLRMRGGWSRHPDDPKHSFRVFFSSEYGESKLKHSLFGKEGADEYDKFDIQTSQNYSWAFYGHPSNTFLRELFSRDTQRDMGQPYTRGKFYHLYINGSYFGLFQIQERPEASYGETYFGGNKEDYDVIKVDVGVNFDIYHVEATNGTLDKWRELWNAAHTGFTSDENYLRVQGLNTDGTVNPSYEKLLDVDNLIDYMINTFFVGDFDAPVTAWRSNNSPNNFYAIYNRVNPDGFKFFRHDAEHSLGAEDGGLNGNDRTGPYPAGDNFEDSNPHWLHQKLSENAHYRLHFADRVYKHFYNDGALTKQKNIERLNKRKAEIETAIIAESARWGDSKTFQPLTKADWTNAVNFITQNFFQNRNSIVLQQLISKGLFLNNLPPQFNRNGGVIDKGFNAILTSTGGDIYYTTDGTDPFTPFGPPGSSFTKTIINTFTNKRVLVPTAPVNNSWLNSTSFDDSGWLVCSGNPGGIGYETGTGYESLISLSVQSQMYQTAANPNNTCYIRIPFEISADTLSQINNMRLQIMCDDGFAAYINGVKVAESNVPANLGWNSAAPNAVEADSFFTFDISAFRNALHEGTNLLAIQGLNSSTGSSDFLILPKLTIGKSAQTGGVSPTAIKYTTPIQLTKTTRIKTRSLTGSTWTALNEALFIVDEDLSSLKVTELHYHPADVDTTSGTEYEFIELKNTGSSTLVLTGASFVNGIEYTFGDTSVAPGGFIVLASNKEEFNKLYGFMPFDEFDGQFDNGGEPVAFVNAKQDTVFFFRYDDADPWPVEADGGGYSLVAKNKSGAGDPNDPAYWIKSGNVNGSPGADDIVSDIKENVSEIPSEYSLMQNYPNPFNPVTNFKFRVPSFGLVTLKIYDVLGDEVTTLVNEVKSSGTYNIRFDAGNLSSGVYFYELKAGSFRQAKKFILLK